MEPKRLYRSTTDRKLAGVAAGLAEYFVMDPLLVRLAFVILTLAGGGGILIYIIMWIVTPDNPNRPYTILDADKTSRGESAAPEGDSPSMNPSETASSARPPSSGKPAKQSRGSLMGGLVLITLGLLFLADELIPDVDFGDLWPVLIIVIGLVLLANAFTRRKDDTTSF